MYVRMYFYQNILQLATTFNVSSNTTLPTTLTTCCRGAIGFLQVWLISVVSAQGFTVALLICGGKKSENITLQWIVIVP